MNAESIPEIVEFITIEEDLDLIVSFAIAAGEPGEVLSLTLMRTPNFENLLPEEEKGVSVSHEAFLDEEGVDQLQRFKLAPPLVSIATASRLYTLDVSKVDPDELQSAQRLLERMTFR